MQPEDVERWQQVDALFSAILALGPSERAAYLAAQDVDDGVRADVRRLLAASDEADAFLEGPPEPDPLLHQQAAAMPSAGAVMAGRRLGPYRIVHEIGRGGMGAVYLAERTDGQFHQRVAIKRLHAGFDSPAVRERFHLERQILARLEHPHITRLIDGGVDDEGCPYLVMEYVEGQPLTAYCDAHRLSVRRRLELFLTVCRAVHHAHRNLIVHRDLKPTNILVSDEGEVKLLDFGIAKLLDDDPAAAAPLVVTQTGLRLLTPGYASPEQVRGEPITTASDVYALGVLLYELLTGRLPYRLTSRLLHEIERVICETEPERPSTVVTQQGLPEPGATGGAGGVDTGRARGTTVERLRRQLSGDLDNVVLMALRKEPERRYASAEAFMEDVRRYLLRLPVEARPSTVSYRAQKFVQRHRVGVAAAAATVLLVAGLSGGFTWRLARERDRAQLEAEKAEQVSAFLVRLFDASDPFGEQAGRGDTLRARTLLDQGAARIEGELADQPALQAMLLDRVGTVYLQLGMWPEAKQSLAKALAQARRVYGARHPEVATILNDLGLVAVEEGDLDRADAYTRQALDIWSAGPRPDPQLATGLHNLGIVRFRQGRFGEADSLYRQALARLTPTDRADSLRVAKWLGNLALVQGERGAYDEATKALEEALAIRERILGVDHPQLALTLNGLSGMSMRRRDHARAEGYVRRGLALLERSVGAAHPNALSLLGNLAMMLENQQKYAEAEPLYRKAMALEQQVYGAGHPETATTTANLAGLLRDTGRLTESEALYRQALALRQQALGADHPFVGQTLSNLGGVLRDQGRYETAADYYRRALRIAEEALPAGHPNTALYQSNLAYCLVRLRRYREAEPLLRESFALLHEALGAGHRFTQVTRERLQELYRATGRAAEADRLGRASTP